MDKDEQRHIEVTFIDGPFYPFYAKARGHWLAWPIRWYRCPHCGQPVDRDPGSCLIIDQSCSKCGAEFIENIEKASMPPGVPIPAQALRASLS